MVKTVLLRPSATAIVPMTVKAKPGERRSARSAYARSRCVAASQRQWRASRISCRVAAAFPQGPPGGGVRLRPAPAPLDLPLHLAREVIPELFLHVGAGAVGGEVAAQAEP